MVSTRVFGLLSLREAINDNIGTMSTESVHIDSYDRNAQTNENLDGLVMPVVDVTRSAPLKVSHVNNVSGKNMVIPQYEENAMDIDVCNDINFSGDFGTPGISTPNGQTITVKGGCQRVHVSGVIHSDAGRQNSHVQVGNFMDQSYAMSNHVTLDFKHINGGKVNVVTGWVVPFSVTLKGSCKWLMWESVKLKAYVVAKFVVRFVLRIPKGVKGPAWM